LERLKINKYTKGNITILVLIIVLVALFTVSTMVKYVYRDVGFAELDENELKALNLAEAGISDMYKNLDRYYNQGEEIPSSPYTLDIVTQGEEQGIVTVNYEVNSSGGSVSGYTVTSDGIDKSGVKRTVKVTINVFEQSSIAMDIFDFIYINNSATYDNNSEAIEGPFYTEGNLTLANAGMLQSTCEGPIVVEGDLTMTGDATNLNSSSLSVAGNVLIEGSSRINGGLVSIGGNLTMTGDTRIDDELESPMIVMGDIDMEGSPEIGEPGRELVLSHHGSIEIPWGDDIPLFIHADLDDSGANPFVFEDPQYNVAGIIDYTLSEIQGSSLIIDEDVFIYAIEGREDRVLFDYQNAHGRLKLSQEDGVYVLDIDGNIIINGDFIIGEEEWWDQTGPHTNTIYYRGRGLIYTTGSIDSLTWLKPLDTGGFPEDDFMLFVSNNDITLDVFRFDWSSPDCSSPSLYVTVIANGLIDIKKGTLTGTAIAGGNLLVNKDFSKACYLENLKEYLPPELPDSSSGGSSNVTFTQQWEEVVPE
jgi:hypothetical protein